MTVSAAQTSLTAAAFSAKWKASKVTGKLVVTGNRTARRDVCDQRGPRQDGGRERLAHAAAGAFTQTFKLGAKFLPGAYDIALVPAAPASQVTPAARRATLGAPPEGVVDVAFLSGARNGTAARTLTGATTIWASFHFAAKPKGTLTLTWYKLGKKRVRIGATTKVSAVKIVSFLKIGKTFKGKYQARAQPQGRRDLQRLRQDKVGARAPARSSLRALKPPGIGASSWHEPTLQRPRPVHLDRRAGLAERRRERERCGLAATPSDLRADGQRRRHHGADRARRER